MVTGEKPDEQVDWADVVRITSPLQEAMDRLSLSVFGLRVSELPEWLDELMSLDVQGGSLRKRDRLRRASLRKQYRRLRMRAARAEQRRAIGVRDV